ncbi:hypothetical protein RUM44_002608 [Polyplax serrata]|uniref:Uncharacterized protein n=1 Tax=Polyplax serrata TaxID=468196 RepID=A0ABR1AF93_POLSC
MPAAPGMWEPHLKDKTFIGVVHEGDNLEGCAMNVTVSSPGNPHVVEKTKNLLVTKKLPPVTRLKQSGKLIKHKTEVRLDEDEKNKNAKFSQKNVREAEDGDAQRKVKGRQVRERLRENGCRIICLSAVYWTQLVPGVATDGPGEKMDGPGPAPAPGLMTL